MCLSEDRSLRDVVLDELVAYVRQAHEDSRNHLRAAFGQDSLDPLGEELPFALDMFPAMLDLTTLKGYFGEVWAGIVAEHFEPHETPEWQVPAFLFRAHVAAFQELERIFQGELPRRIPGRSGNDGLAFTLGDDGTITRVMVCEAKCTEDHRTDLIADAHSQVSDRTPYGVDLVQLIHILQDSSRPDAPRWIAALRRLLNGRSPAIPRYDLVVYVCGRSPSSNGRTTWIDATKPHSNYTAKRHLQATEIQLTNVEDFVRQVYEKDVQ